MTTLEHRQGAQRRRLEGRARMMNCAVVMCSQPRFTNGVPHPFCLEHQQAFEQSPEGIRPQPTGQRDFVERVWKEECNRKSQEKWDKATPEQRADWKKGGFGR